MDIGKNPFRIAGILSNATAKELQKQKGKIQAYIKVGKEVEYEYDFPVLFSRDGVLTRTEDSIKKAYSLIEQNQDKVNYALFWFLNASPFDSTAIEYLKNGDDEKAVKIWETVVFSRTRYNYVKYPQIMTGDDGDYTIEDVIIESEKEGLTRKETIEVLQDLGFSEYEINKATNDETKPAYKKIVDNTPFGKFRSAFRDVNSENFSAFNNFGTYKLLSSDKNDIKTGIEAKLNLINSEYFENFVHSVADETFTINNQNQSEKFIDELLMQFEIQYSSSEILILFSGCDETTQKYLSKKLTEGPLHKIESQIESCKKKRKAEKGSAYEFGLKLFRSSKDDLSLLKSLLGTSDIKYKAVADQLANEIMQCGIDYFNESQENDSSEDFLKQARELNDTALTIAVGSLVRDRVKDHISTLEEMKDREVAQAIALLQSVKDAYETNEKDIILQIEKLKESIEFLLGEKTINQNAVADNIKNSIDWDKVNELLKEILPDEESLVRIKASSNNELKSEFVELAYWLKDYSQKSVRIKKIIDYYKNIPPKLPFKIISSEITNTDGKPLFRKFIRYIGLNLKLEIQEDSDVTFYLKYLDPYGNVSRNSKSSPMRYTISDSFPITKNTTLISFVGWGNAKTCDYKLGEHQIKVYIDEYLIHTKKYTVDLAPSERLGQEIKSAELELRRMNRGDYRTSEIRSAKNEMSEIQKFKLFRGSSEKQSQIDSQQTKIDKLIKKSQKEKKKDIKALEEKICKLKMELSAAKY